MKIEKSLLTEFVARYPAQPATAFWRAIEIDMLANAELPEGLGLDLGCGDGILTDILFQRAGLKPRLVGIDLDPLETEAAANYDFYDRIHTCGAANIPEADGTFDYVISNSVLEHIPELEPVIAEVGRLLKKGGQFFFTVPAPGFYENLSGSMFAGVSKERYLIDLDRRLAHFHYLSESDWEAMCDRNGLKLDKAVGYLDKAETQRWENLSRVTGGLLHSLSGGKARPIEIQRSLKLRSLQNRKALPRPVAGAVASILEKGLSHDRGTAPSCLLVVGHKR